MAEETPHTRLLDRLRELCALPAETDWAEFKVNNSDPQMIGRTISALSNAAALHEKPLAWLIWGVRDDDHAVIGTAFNHITARSSGHPLPFWLSQRLQPDCPCHFESFQVDGKSIVMLEIPAAVRAPTMFEGIAYTRIGPATPKLSDYPERQRLLWQKLSQISFEEDAALSSISADDVLALLDVQACFDLLGQPLPDGRSAILGRLEAERVIRRDVGSRWDVLNLGALLFAKDIGKFSRLSRKALRVVRYRGRARVEAISERMFERGYAAGFAEMVALLTSLLPANELIGKAFRQSRPLYPEIALRELMANALLHQDLSVSGAGPMIEIFDDRIEMTNPGTPLVAPDRFLDLPPRSRNETMAALMRRMNICEERGSGIDKVIFSVEVYQLPPPDFRQAGESTRAVLFAPRPFSGMSREERVRAAYQHAGLLWLSDRAMTNPTLRERFGISERNAAMVTRVINDALDFGVIKPADPDNRSRKLASYYPIWA